MAVNPAMATGEGSKIIQLKDHKFLLDEEKLKSILLREDIKGLPVVLVSVAGAFRGGKSFLLNFFLRYLKAPQSAREDGSWLEIDSDSLKGFGWRSGSNRNTTGIDMWPEPFICNLPVGHTAGDKVAVLLMDTQGTFDNKSTTNECSTIFAISALLSSTQIYNVSRNIQEDHLNHLHLFTEYGRLVKDQTNGPAFQILEFLVRDWDFDWEHPFGYVGGEELLNLRLAVASDMSKELKDVRTHIRSCFEKVSCYLMPHPGRKVSRSNFVGNLKDIGDEFLDNLKILVPSIFSSEKLVPKVINGTVVTAQDLFTYMSSYIKAFSSGSVPPTADIVTVTTQAGLLNTARDELTQYENSMDKECGKKTQLCVPIVDVKELHNRFKNQALNNFNAKRKMGSKDDAKPYYNKLSEDIEKRLEQYASINLVKYRDLEDKAMKSYEDEIKKIANGELLCLHAVDVGIVHNEAVNEAVRVFDAGQRRSTTSDDPGRNDFVKKVNKNLSDLRSTNEANNKQIIDKLRSEYATLMENSIVAANVDILPETDLKKLDDENSAKVLEMFKRKRSRADIYTEDVYKTQLIKAMEKRFQEISRINKSSQGRAIKTAVLVYENSIKGSWDKYEKNLHPDELKEVHDRAVCEAITSLHPNEKYCQVNPRSDCEMELNDILNLRYADLRDLNEADNKRAIENSLLFFAIRFEELTKPSWWWSLVVPMVIDTTKTILNVQYEQARDEAITKFYTWRQNKGQPLTDIYLYQLKEELAKRNPYVKIGEIIKQVIRSEVYNLLTKSDLNF